MCGMIGSKRNIRATSLHQSPKKRASKKRHICLHPSKGALDRRLWHALKIAHRAPPQFRGELKQSIRQEMEKNSECKDKQKIRYLISEGLERIKQLDEMLDMQGH
ncbi:unnamed protein product [Brassica rapa]|uniref:Complex 1 LYR protein domain-containing protein n=2 Tax=Brassica TaxID=3705 RepID=A0A8D9H9B8_BRACM|nr:unnamed protein product [Brassica napus]CAG7895529.1 unnamed protein product [Brassica rapa]